MPGRSAGVGAKFGRWSSTMRRFGTLSLILSIDSSSTMRGIRRIEHEVGVGEELEPIDENRIVRLLRDIAPPQIAVSDAAEERMLPVAIEVLLELGLVGFQIADHADDDRVALRNVEHPEVVFDPGARFHFDRADRTQRHRQLAIAIGVGRHGSGAGHARPAVRRALRAGRIEKMNVRVDYGDCDPLTAGALRHGGDGCPCDTGHKVSPSHPRHTAPGRIRPAGSSVNTHRPVSASNSKIW